LPTRQCLGSLRAAFGGSQAAKEYPLPVRASSRHTPLSARPRPTLAQTLVLIAVAVLAACTSGGDDRAADRSAGTPSTAARPAPLDVDLVASGRSTDPKLNVKRAAKRSAPSLERFIGKYLTVAFLDAAGKPPRSHDLLTLFDKPVRTAARKQLDALSLGTDAVKVSSVQPDRADARAVLLFRGRRAAAATVRLSFDGTASGDRGSGPVHLRSVFQLLATPDGWRISGFSSRTGPAR
jgi:hypothetical protein